MSQIVEVVQSALCASGEAPDDETPFRCLVAAGTLSLQSKAMKEAALGLGLLDVADACVNASKAEKTKTAAEDLRKILSTA